MTTPTINKVILCGVVENGPIAASHNGIDGFKFRLQILDGEFDIFAPRKWENSLPFGHGGVIVVSGELSHNNGDVFVTVRDSLVDIQILESGDVAGSWCVEEACDDEIEQEPDTGDVERLNSQTSEGASAGVTRLTSLEGFAGGADDEAAEDTVGTPKQVSARPPYIGFNRNDAHVPV